jgi:hypothetical protein
MINLPHNDTFPIDFQKAVRVDFGLNCRLVTSDARGALGCRFFPALSRTAQFNSTSAASLSLAHLRHRTILSPEKNFSFLTGGIQSLES